jgi:hypothetical protein
VQILSPDSNYYLILKLPKEVEREEREDRRYLTQKVTDVVPALY